MCPRRGTSTPAPRCASGRSSISRRRLRRRRLRSPRSSRSARCLCTVETEARPTREAISPRVGAAPRSAVRERAASRISFCRGGGSTPPPSGALFGARPDEPVVLVLEQDVERREGAVDARDVLLQLHLVLFAEFRVRVDPLLQDTQPVARHGNLVKEHLDRNG